MKAKYRKRALVFMLFITAALVFALVPAVLVLATPTMYENYTTGDDLQYSYCGLGNTFWAAQTFTPAAAHTITSVKLKLYRTSTPGPGTVTVSITATDGSGHPTGADLCSGTTDGNTLTYGTGDYFAGEWREITLGGYSLAAGTKYAIVVKPAAGGLRWKLNRNGGYAGGNYEEKNGGNPWVSRAYDFMFEEWGAAGWTQTTDTDFNAGTLSQVAVSGTGTPASVKLAQTTGAETLDQSMTTYYGSVYPIHKQTAYWYMVAQTFTAGMTGQLTKVSIYVRDAGASGTDPNLYIDIRDVASGKPGTTTYGTASKTPAEVPDTAGWVDFTFSGVSVTSGTQYAIVARSNCTSGQYSWNEREGNPYSAGVGYYTSDSGTTWTVVYGPGDMMFSTYVTSLVYYTSGSLVSSKKDTGQASDFDTISFTINEPTNTDLKFQIRTAATQGGLDSATWYGPTGTGDYYQTSGTSINSIHNGGRWVQYKAYFSTTDTTKTPRLDDITISYEAAAAPTIEITAPADISGWALSPQAEQPQEQSGTLGVTCSGGWQVTVKDADAATGGKMTDWSGSAYGTIQLANFMTVAADSEVTLPTEGTIASGSGDASVNVTFKQTVSWSDQVLPEGHSYRIIVTFTGSVVP